MKVMNAISVPIKVYILHEWLDYGEMYKNKFPQVSDLVYLYGDYLLRGYSLYRVDEFNGLKY